MSTATRPRQSTQLEQTSGNFPLIDTLRRWGITFYSGVNGGGLIHVAKHLQPFFGLDQAGDGIPRMHTMSEYVAGFVPLGYFLASGKVADIIVVNGKPIDHVSDVRKVETVIRAGRVYDAQELRVATGLARR